MSMLPAPPADLLEGSALFLDFDGTLVELAETPDGIAVSSTLPGLLRSLSDRLSGRMAIVSGRAVGNLESHLNCAGIAVSGSHGLELRLANGTMVPLAAPIDLAELRDKIARFASGTAGLIIEEKPASIALHYRKAPEEAERVDAFMSLLAERSGLTLQRGKMVVELRPRGADKGDAVRAFMAEPQFGGARPIFIGDDVTDEDGMRAANELGGFGIAVGERESENARYALASPAAVHHWLGL